MSRRLDHLVLCNRDLDLAAQAYQALGFTLTPRAVHPFGTCNRLVQFNSRSFLEILAVDDRTAIPAHGAPDHFSFGAHNQSYIDRLGQGFSMLCFASQDARADVAEFRGKGLQTYEPFDFGRDAQLPDGSFARVGFSLAFVTHPGMNDTAFFTCQQQHPPELFWKPQYQSHANTAEAVVEVILTAEEPEQLADFFTRLTGAAAVGEGDRLSFGPPTDQLTVLTPKRFQERFGQMHSGQGGPSLQAYRITVGNLQAARTCLRAGNIAFQELSHNLVVAPSGTQGVVIEFSQI